MASIGFTVAAGTYVVNQMDSDQHEAAVGPHPNVGVTHPIPAPPHQIIEPAVPQSPTTTVRFVAEARELPVIVDLRAPVVITPAPIRPITPTTAAVQANSDPGTRLELPADAYLGANLTSTQPDSLSVTLDTNLLAALSDTTAGTTSFRTDLDIRHGSITLAVSDPVLGNQSVRMAPRHTDPLQAPDPAQSVPADHELATT